MLLCLVAQLLLVVHPNYPMRAVLELEKIRGQMQKCRINMRTEKYFDIF